MANEIKTGSSDVVSILNSAIGQMERFEVADERDEGVRLKVASVLGLESNATWEDVEGSFGIKDLREVSELSILDSAKYQLQIDELERKEEIRLRATAVLGLASDTTWADIESSISARDHKEHKILYKQLEGFLEQAAAFTVNDLSGKILDGNLEVSDFDRELDELEEYFWSMDFTHEMASQFLLAMKEALEIELKHYKQLIEGGETNFFETQEFPEDIIKAFLSELERRAMKFKASAAEL